MAHVMDLGERHRNRDVLLQIPGLTGADSLLEGGDTHFDTAETVFGRVRLSPATGNRYWTVRLLLEREDINPNAADTISSNATPLGYGDPEIGSNKTTIRTKPRQFRHTRPQRQKGPRISRVPWTSKSCGISFRISILPSHPNK